jgi:AcrR family transcriptional regulator
MNANANHARRPRNAARSREAILAAARRLFSTDSYDDVGLRDIGAAAGVDPALIIRYFGSKEALFAAALDASAQDAEIFSGTIDDFAARVSALLIEPKSGPKLQSFLMMLQSATSQKAARLTEAFLAQQVSAPLIGWLDCEDAPIRAQMALSVMLGAALARTITPEFGLDRRQKDELRGRIGELLVFCLAGAR